MPKKYDLNSAIAIDLQDQNRILLSNLEDKFQKLNNNTKTRLKDLASQLLDLLADTDDAEDLNPENINNTINQSCFEDLLSDFMYAEYQAIQEKITGDLSIELESQVYDLDDKLESLEHAKELTNKLEYLLPELDNYYSSKGEYFTYKELQDLTDECIKAIKAVDELL